ncbi:MAG: alkaline phosphatase PhoX, partial [Rubrivivax sp.]
LHAGGALQALRLRDGGGRSVDTARGLRSMLGRPLPVDWVAVDEPDHATDDVRAQAHARGAARFSRGEGLWAGGPGGTDDRRITLVSTSGGDAGAGQVFALDPGAGQVTLVAESSDRALLDGPDNVGAAPDGRLLLCEDGGGGNGLVGLEPDGTLFTFARNLFNGSEFCGACSSPDGRFLFVNLQTPGLTLVIEGPWRAAGR